MRANLELKSNLKFVDANTSSSPSHIRLVHKSHFHMHLEDSQAA